MSSISLSIIHYPIYDKNRQVIATSVTNLEIHDVARTCMTFGIDLCYIITPLAKQQGIVEKMIHHWSFGYGARYNPARKEALERVRIKGTVKEMLDELGTQGTPIVVGTSSRIREGKAIGYTEFRDMAQKETRPVLLLFGTGWGLTDEVVDVCDRMLLPIQGGGNYNHLSLRVAIGIILDRIFGERGGYHE